MRERKRWRNKGLGEEKRERRTLVRTRLKHS